MANHALLNNVDHKDLRIITRRSAEFGDDVQFAVTFSWEFRSIQAHYPIFFRKDAASDRFAAVALFGFEEGENLFLNEAGWDANYLPLTVQQRPFLIGFQQAGGSAEKEPVIHIDLDSPRVSETDGEAMFLQHGGVSDYLDGITSVLNTIREGYAVSQLFVEELGQRGLLEPVALDVELKDGSQNRLMGFYTISEEALFELDGEALEDLNRKGFLMPIYMAIASLSSIRDLIDRKNALLEL